MTPSVEPGGVVTLVPAATEFCFVLDAWDLVRAVSHECDFPPMAADMPKVTRSRVDAAAPPSQIDRRVKEIANRGESLYDLDAELLAKIKPDLLIAQTVCEVCAITPKEVARATRGLKPAPEILEMDEKTLEDVFRTFRKLGERLDRREAARRELLKQWSLAKQIRGMTSKLSRPRIAVLDWIEPVMFAGHWTRELCAMASAEYGLVPKGEKSRWGSWEELAEYDPDVIVVTPCGRSVEASASEMSKVIRENRLTKLAAVQAGRLFAGDGNRYFNRPGPRLIYSAALLARAAHWEDVPALPPAIESGVARILLPEVEP